MKNIDIIKAAQHVDDKYINEAIDLVPIQKHSFKWAYITAAACAALVITAVPIIAKYKHTTNCPESSGGWNESSSYNGTTPTVADTKLSEGTPRTFYKIVTEEQTENRGAAQFGRINITNELAEWLSKPHDPQDLFAVSVLEHSKGHIQKIYDEFAEPYDLNRWFMDINGEGALFMTEEQIKALNKSEIASDLSIVLDLAAADYRAEEIDADSLKTERFGKIYAEIKLNCDYEKAKTELGLPGAVNANGEEMENGVVYDQFAKDFAADYGIDIRLLFGKRIAGSIGSSDITLCGEFDLETIKKMLDDERVVSISKSNGGGYVYENYGLFLSAVKVTRKQMEKLPSGLTYREIFERLGNTAAFGRLMTRFYVTEDAKLIALSYDRISDVCSLSGNELYDSAIPLYYDGERPDTVDNDMTYAVTGIYGLFISLDSNGYLTAGYGDKAPEGCEIIHEDGTPSDKLELHQVDRRVFYKADYQLESSPPLYQCTKIVLLDD